MSSNNSNSKSKNVKADFVRHLITGTKATYPNGSTVLRFGAVDHTVNEVETTLQRFVDNRDAVVAAQTNATAKVEVENVQEPALLAFIGDYVKFLRGVAGNGTDALAVYGIPPLKARKPLTSEQLAAATAKRDATRKARGTTGKKEKKAIKGAVTGVVVTPVTSSPTPSSGGTPAPTASGTTPATTSPAPTPPATPHNG
jgi:hypothetical protein